MDHDEEEGTAFLSTGHRKQLQQSKSRLTETLQLGSEIIKHLHSDQETLRRLNSTTRKMQDDTLSESSDALRRIERRKVFELTFVCLALTAVLCGMFFLLVYKLMLFGSSRSSGSVFDSSQEEESV